MQEPPVDDNLGCDGLCLKQMSQDKYYREGDCAQNCQPIKCPNYLLCGQPCPQWFLWCHSNRCNYCNESFGCDLTFIEKVEECCVCMIEKPVFIRWGCPHELCVDCFRLNHAYTIKFQQECDAYDAAYPREIILDNNGWEIDSPPVERPQWLGQCPLCRHREIPMWRNKRLGL